MIVGLDEAGRGPLCGPVVACAFYFRKKNTKLRIRDSKKTPFLKRQEIFEYLLKKGIFSLSVVSSGQIDKHNILNATMIAFNRAINGIINQAPFLKKAMFIVDGNIFRTGLKIKYECVKKADEKITEVACASILAKVFRDYLMQILDVIYPDWGLHQHKGYPTKFHRELLKTKKPTPFHRRSFCKTQM
ncbi:MAG: ribonuclease HII [Candidatus Omnitrophica bacterium]|nr:ribonuclease HII [Candidatus Omnitrophota bacterium]